MKSRSFTRSWVGTAALAALLGVPLAAAAQTPPPPPPPVPTQPPPAGQTPPATQAPPPAEVYSYNPTGRRDPFVSLLSRGAGDLRPDNRPEGVGGLLINDITVRGIVKTTDGFVAMLQAPDNRTYIVHVNDRLFDGTIKAITVDTLVFSQEVNDPLSLVKQREVRKTIRPLQEGK